MSPTNSTAARRLYIECGTTARSSINTGIQRVVWNIVRESLTTAPLYGFDPFPVSFSGGRFVQLSAGEKLAFLTPAPPSKSVALLLHFLLTVDRVINRILWSSLYQWGRNRLSNKIKPLLLNDMQNDCAIFSPYFESCNSLLLLLDSTWDNSIWQYVDAFRSKGGVVCAVLYDLIPFSHPETVAEDTRLAHTSWWSEAPLHLDAIMCISQAVRNDYLAWQDRQAIAQPLSPEKVGFFYLGAELNRSDPVTRLFSEHVPYFMMVGSLEPRKNHKTVLDAFDLLWEQGIAARLVIIGAFGWKSEDLLNRILKHHEFDKQLFLIRDASDRDLTALYGMTSGLIIASLAEGFGLPIVEAYQRGAPVICSDIPVFREVAGDQARYFDVLDAQALAVQIIEQLKNRGDFRAHPNVVEKPWINWRQSSEQLLNKLSQFF